jgi:hypothetical protein
LPSEQTEKYKIVEKMRQIVMKKWAGKDTPGLVIKHFPIYPIKVHQNKFVIGPAEGTQDLNNCDEESNRKCNKWNLSGCTHWNILLPYGRAEMATLDG